MHRQRQLFFLGVIMKFTIKNIFNKTIVSEEANSLKEVVENNRANLAGANLAGANLVGANLVGAYLVGAYLAGANLAGANLAGATLVGATLAGATLDGATLVGANGEKTKIKKIPIQISTDTYHIIIFDKDMRIGCEYHSLENWFKYKTSRIDKMEGDKAVNWWKQWKSPLKKICKNTSRI
ncbi:MAG: pentapeptide repeat-containing protein [Gammaproteobacteria bacterium]|nr:pentapeptide repeat-containing protein [Gammaproteobacteria bacterium]